MIKVVIEVTSKADLPLSDSIVETLERLGIQSVLRVDSARKTKQRDEAEKYQAQVSDEFTGNDIYSGLVNIQRRVKQYLSMAEET